MSRRPLALLMVSLSLGLPIAGPVAAFETDTCLLKPKRTIQLGSSVYGVLDTVNVDRGARVAKGDVLAQLDTTVERAQVSIDKHRGTNTAAIDSAQTNMNWNLRELDRKKRLRDNMFSKINDVDELETKIAQDKLSIKRAQFDLKIAELELARSQAQLQLKLIRSPIDGVVTEIKLNPGEYIRDTTPVMTLVEISTLNADIFVPAGYYPRLKVGMPIELVLDAPLNTSLSAEVDAIDPVIDAASDTFRVRLAIDNASGRLLAGVRCKAILPPVQSSSK